MSYLAAILIHLIIPLVGLIAFIRLARRWRAEGAPSSSLAQLFFIFFCYGGLLLIILTSLFWQWSGAASLGFFFVLFVAPLPMIAIAVRHHWRPSGHPSQRFIRNACAAYCPILGLWILAIFLLEPFLR